MKIRILVLSFALLFGSMGCVVPITAMLSTEGVMGAGYNQYLAYDLKKKQLELEREKFELKKRALLDE